jgi:hypothetical protein
MKIQDIKDIISTRKAANVRAFCGKNLKTRKGVSDVVEKVTSLVVRGGIDYDNMKVVKEGREDGSLPSENAGLPWGEWAEFPYHIAHKGQDYARFYPASGNDISTGKGFVPHVEYYLNGELTTKEAVTSICLASEFPERKFILTDLCDPNEEVKKLNIEEVKEFLKGWNDVYGTSFESPEDFDCPLYSLVEEKPLCFTIKAENVRAILV